MNIKHTPLPWKIASRDNYDTKGIGIFGTNAAGGSYYIAHVGYLGSADVALAEANAHLIAAAPDLLFELEKLADWVENNVPYGGGEGTLDFAYAAIRRAHGDV